MEDLDKYEEASWATTVDVYIQVSFAKIYDIDTINQRFQAEAIIESKWHDPGLKTLNEIVDEKKIWKPNLYVENSIKDDKDEISYKVIRDKASEQLMVCEVRKVKGLFWECLELQKFPLDVQDLSLTIASKKPGKIVNFVLLHKGKKTIKVSNTLDKSMWEMHKFVFTDHDQITREYSYGERRYPAIKVTAQVFRLPGFFYWNALLPILLVTMASLGPFVIDAKIPQSRLPSTATMLLTSVSIRWIIGRLLPTVSYLTSLDKYSLGSIVIIVMELLYHACIGALYPSLDPIVAYRLDKGAFLVFVSLILFKQILFLAWVQKVSRYRKKVRTGEKLHVVEKSNDEGDNTKNRPEQELSLLIESEIEFKDKKENLLVRV